MFNWQSLLPYSETNTPFVLVTVGAVKGSSPRETGAKMLITEKDVLGTIGGGNLEYFAIEKAQTLLQTGLDNTLEEHKTPLTPQFDQCCGGLVQIIFEKVNPVTSLWFGRFVEAVCHNQQAWLMTDIQQNQRFIKTDLETKLSNPNPNSNSAWLTKQSILIEPLQNSALPVYLFGTGHVGKAIIRQLHHLNVDITAVDSRPDQIPNDKQPNVNIMHSNDWQSVVKNAPNNAYFLVLTHSHQLDYQIAEAILRRNSHHYFGLIGSKTKKIRFERQLIASGVSASQLTTMTCPIGLPDIKGKTPEVIAASVIAQILQIQSARLINQTAPHLSQETRRIQHV